MSDYTFVWGDYQPDFTIETNIKAFRDNRSNVWNKSERIILVSRNNFILAFHSKKDLLGDAKKGGMYLNKSKSGRFIKDMESDYKKHWRFYNSLKTVDFSGLSDKELARYFRKFAEYWCRIIGYFRASHAEGTRYLIDELKKHFTGQELSLIITPTEPDVANKELMDWQELLKKRFSDDLIVSHAKKYPYLAMSHWTYRDLIDTLKQRYDYDKANIKFKDMLAEKNEIKSKQEGLIKRTPKIKPLIRLAQRLALSRMEIKSCWAGSEFYMIPLLNEIAKRTGEPIQDIARYYLTDEIWHLLEGKPLSEQEKTRRTKCFVGLWKGGEISFVSGDEAEDTARMELGDLYRIKDTNTLKGTTANPGKVTAKARILMANDVEQTRIVRKDFKKGEVLVTQMTQPSIMDIASRASAFVTDEGGMLSHAAIISRELGIPCIVGTHFATQIIRDGETIEVDANKGIVRRLSKDEAIAKKFKNQD